MINEEHATNMLGRLSDMGVRISTDDFGTGYSSLAHLSELPIYEIKIDRSFVEDMDTNPKHAKIVRSINHLGHNLGLNVIAEGVSKREIKYELQMMRCDAIQGFYLSAPIAPEEIPNWLRQNKVKLPYVPVGVYAEDGKRRSIV